MSITLIALLDLQFYFQCTSLNTQQTVVKKQIQNLYNLFKNVSFIFIITALSVSEPRKANF